MSVSASEKRKEGIFVLHDTRTRSKLLHHHQGAEQYGFHLVHPFSPQNGTDMPFAIAVMPTRRNPHSDMGRTPRLRLLLNRCAVTSHSVWLTLRHFLDNAARHRSEDINQTFSLRFVVATRKSAGIAASAF